MERKGRSLRRTLAALLFVLLLADVGAHAFAGATSGLEPVEYIDENGEKQICTDYQLLDTDNFPDVSGVTLEGGWYVVRGKVAYQNRLRIDANFDPHDARACEEAGMAPARFILCDGCDLRMMQGIWLDMDNALQIYAQSGGTGSLYAEYNETGDYSNRAHAVIGGNAPRGSGGCLDINGGMIRVTGDTAGACVGGSAGGALDELNIRGGKVSIENTGGAPAIGVGLSYNSTRNRGRVHISGGEVSTDSYFKGLRTADAIGGHYECGGLMELRITGGKVTAFGRYATVDEPQCAMMTRGDLILGDDMLVAAGDAPGHITQAAKADRVSAIRSNTYAEVWAPDFPSAPITATAFTGSILSPTLLVAASAAAVAVAAILITRRRRQGGR